MSPLTPSDLELARLASPGTPDAQLVVQLAQRTLAELATEPPISHEIVASMRDVIRVDEEDIPWPGCLTHTVDGLVITLRRSDSRGRKRFTAFHEILHTFLPGFAMHTQFRCEPAGTQPTEAQPRDRDIETLCDVGAAELLFPRGPFSADLADAPVTFELVEQLATRYDASVEATARRVVSLHPRPALLLVLASTRKPLRPSRASSPESSICSIQWLLAICAALQVRTASWTPQPGSPGREDRRDSLLARRPDDSSDHRRSHQCPPISLHRRSRGKSHARPCPDHIRQLAKLA